MIVEKLDHDAVRQVDESRLDRHVRVADDPAEIRAIKDGRPPGGLSKKALPKSERLLQARDRDADVMGSNCRGCRIRRRCFSHVAPPQIRKMRSALPENILIRSSRVKEAMISE